jgi:hypothetical protein
MTPPSEDAPWGEYRRLVLAELERIARDMESLADKVERFRADELAAIRTEVALLKQKAAFWGAIAGVIVTVLVSLIPKFIR